MNGVPQVSATQPFSVTLTAQEWNAVVAALAEAPYRISAPLIQMIGEQVHQQATATVNGQDVVEARQ